MRVTTSLVTTAMVLMFSSVVMAQNSSTGSSSTLPPNISGIPSTVPEAPIGHRQPRADEVPNEKNLADPNTPMNKDDALLDRKIKSICRGC
jgi:hypothetical protein